MKTYISTITAVVLVLSLCAWPQRSEATGADTPRDSLIHIENLDFLAIGAVYEKQKRDLVDEWGNPGRLESRHAYAFLSMDVFWWLTVNAGIGRTELKPAKLMTYGDEKDLWTAGVRANLWEHDVTDPTFMVHRFRVQATGSYWEHEADYLGHDLTWEEWRAALLFQAESFVSNFGYDTTVYPFSVIFSVGPVYSEIDMEADIPFPWGGPALPAGMVDIEEEDDVGVLISIDVNIAHNFSAGWECRLFDEATHSANIAFHF